MRIEPGEQLPDRPGARGVLVAETDDLCVTLFRVAPGGPGAEPHVHHLHADSFLVLDGAMRMHLDGAEQVVEAESWAQLPARVVHGYALGPRGATFLNVHAPATGFGPYIRALFGGDPEEVARARATFDQHPPSADDRTTGAIVSRLGGVGGETVVDRPGRRVSLLADAEELSVTESVYGPGMRGPDPHVHHDHTDAWLVLEGALTFTLRDGLGFEAPAGTFVAVPRDVVHGFANTGADPARFLNLHAPGCGFGDYVRGRKPDFDQHAQTTGGGDPGTVVARRVEL